MPAIVMNYGGGADPQELAHFAAVTSPFYPELREWCDRVLQEWSETLLAEIHEGEEEEDPDEE